MKTPAARVLIPALALALACSDALPEASVTAPETVATDRRRPVDVSDVPPGTKADTALVQRRHAPLLVGARVQSDGRIIRDGVVLGALRSRLRASTDRGHVHPVRDIRDVHELSRTGTPDLEADPSPGRLPTTVARLDKQECLYLITYYLDNGEIISIERLWCPSTPSGGSSPGGGSSCTADQEAIAREYANDENVSGGPWTCDKFDDAVKRGTGTHGHATGYISSTLRTGRSAVWQDMRVLHDVTGGWNESDWRCPVGNASLPKPGAKNSRHMRGRANDFDAPNWTADLANKFETVGRSHGATEVIRYSGSIHLGW